MRERFTGRVALVTGAGAGLGRAIALALGAEGAAVAVNDVDAGRVDETVSLVRSAGGTAYAVPFDVASSEQVDRAMHGVLRDAGRLDILVNNAGLLQFPSGTRQRQAAWDAARDEGRPWGSLHTTVSIDDDLWRKHMSVMVDGVFYCTRAALRIMEPAGSGAIINVASLGAMRPSPAAPHYAAAKAAVIAFTQSVGQEVAGSGIRVNGVAPGAFDTDIAGRLPAGARSQWATAIPMARLGRPDELASVVLFLASDEASFCAGEMFTVTGGGW